MKFTETSIPGVWQVDMQRLEDPRGWFARSWCAAEFASQGLVTHIEQCSSSFNKVKGTLRGMHWQARPHMEAKVVRCTRGSVFDVALDLRPESPTYRQWTAAELSSENGRALYIPEGCAHGFQTLEDNTEISYLISTAYHPASSRGCRWDDPSLGVQWPLPHLAILSDKDRQTPLLTQLEPNPL